MFKEFAYLKRYLLSGRRFFFSLFSIYLRCYLHFSLGKRFLVVFGVFLLCFVVVVEVFVVGCMNWVLLVSPDPLCFAWGGQ